ncbi:NAD-dependent succinate-semialdehyde dehydrogenase [Microbacterium sp.]|uniref:NAD-dependent succinate-semialdehyde dehydrogenase n=1 Tax=Microbacterium sp. TaxID=51671 RepID=UPI0028113071|nr:NAD-dependent succinate-semialdehyde dehydrogenase [Microbacterium sp.]
MTDYAVVNPATGTTEAAYDTFTDEQIEQAVAAADAAHRGWSRSSTVAERAALVRRMAELHRERRETLADIFVREMGKTREAALGEADFAADIAEYYADQAEAIMKDQPIDIVGEGTAVIRKSSLGPLVGIMPWNFPAYQIVRFAAPNLIVGNTILLKPAPQCPESSTAIAEIYRDAGFPDGAYQNVLATNEQIAAMIADPRVAGVSLTGSERAGAAVAEVAGRNLKKVALELGGSDPFIVLSTDDLDATVQAGVDARLDNNGQACNGAKRFIIVDELYDAFVEKFTAKMAEARPSDPMQEDTVLGPVSSEAAAQRLQEQIDQAVGQGATLLTGGKRQGAFFEPTVLADVTRDMNVYHEELFGPAAVVYRVADEDAAVELANDTTFGLGSYVFTTDPEQAERVANRLEAGMVYVNCVLADSPELPFGGIKRSGTARELGHLAADEFVNKKLIRVA